jgi:hypothetical protein
VQADLKTELGEMVPIATVSRWMLRSSRGSEGPTISELADRTIRLLSQEMTRLERSNTRPDLDRMAKVAQILRTLDGLKTVKTDRARRTLSDLDQIGETDGSENSLTLSQ